MRTHIPGVPFEMDPDEYQVHIVRIAALAGIILLIAARDCVLLYAARFEKVPQHTSLLVQRKPKPGPCKQSK
jgi:hypothetical protein